MIDLAMRNSAHETSCTYQMVFKPTKLIGNFSHGICNGYDFSSGQSVILVHSDCLQSSCNSSSCDQILLSCLFFFFFTLLSARLQRRSSLYAFVSYLGSVAKFQLNVKSMLYFSLRCTTCKVHFSIVDLVACKSNGHVFFGAFAMKIAY